MFDTAWRVCDLINILLATSILFPNILESKIVEFWPIFLDVHRQLHFTLTGLAKTARGFVDSDIRPKHLCAVNEDIDKNVEFTECFVNDEQKGDIVVQM